MMSTESDATAKAVKADDASAGLLFVAIKAAIGDLSLTVGGGVVAGGKIKGSSSDSEFSLSVEA
jgi:hypothetical protein